jgi:hypothetical protein
MSLIHRLRVGWVSHRDGELAAAEIERLQDEIERLKREVYSRRLSMDGKIRRDIMTKLTVPLWPTAGKALGLGRSLTYEGARAGKIETIEVGRRRPVPTSFLRRKLGLEEPRRRSKVT